MTACALSTVYISFEHFSILREAAVAFITACPDEWRKFRVTSTFMTREIDSIPGTETEGSLCHRSSQLN